MNEPNNKSNPSQLIQHQYHQFEIIIKIIMKEFLFLDV